jgi:ribosomal protein S1
MRRDRTHMEYFHVVHLKKIFQAGDRIVAQMLMVDGVVLQTIEQ